MSQTQANASPVVSGPAAAALQEQQSGTSNMAGPGAATGDEKPGFAQQAKGYAKEFAGKTFGKEHEVAQGQAVRKEGVDPAAAKAEITPETVGQTGGAATS